ncbi:hypothetical protein DPMN_018270 [Dreissena polymorpha]|uniref:Uncharacterized protein n=1 Tax=Dreissena polymorpha TaxID=45954 RepID=A0A9D4NCW6_DREPO|nr:hypothetical protein DPMN_018270 [Dreissena polymorpha]
MILSINIIGTNLLTKFHEDRKINVASTVLTRKNAPPPGSHAFQPRYYRDNFLTKFHEDRTVNVASRVLTRFYNSHIRKNAPRLGSHVFQGAAMNKTIVKQYKSPTGSTIKSVTDGRRQNQKSPPLKPVGTKNAPPPGGHVFQPTGIIFELFHEDHTINMASRVKKAPPLGSHVFQANVTIFELIQDIIETNLLTKFHED